MQIPSIVIALVIVSNAAPALAQVCFDIEPPAVYFHSPSSVAFADVDGDGDPDLGTIDWGEQSIVLMWNDGHGTWAAQQPLVAGPHPTHLDFADLDGDGDADLVYANAEPAHTITVRRNLGGATFGAAETYAVSSVPEHFACGDLDNDGDTDLVVACFGAGTGGTGILTLLFNQGDGTFVVAPGPLAGARRVAVTDFDIDGDLDVVAVRSLEPVVHLLRNNGQGAFPGVPASIPVLTYTNDVVAADFDGDGRPDLAVAQENNRFSILFSTPGGSFAPYVEYWGSHMVRRLIAADLDDDGDVDLVAPNWLGGAPTMYQNAGNGTFAAAGTFAVGPNAGPPASADVDGDGDQDLAFPLGGQTRAVRLLRNCTRSGETSCFGDGSATACPCGNASPAAANAGCLHSLGAGGTLRASGIASLAADSLLLRGASMPNASALYFQGTTAVNGGLGSVFGDGLMCAGGTLIRLGTATNSAGSSQYPAIGQVSVSVRGAVSTPGVRDYQVWYRNAASFCTPSTFNLTNSLRLTWRL